VTPKPPSDPKEVNGTTAARLVRFNVADIKVEGRHRKEMGDIQALADSIARDGLAQPPGVRPDGSLIYGQRRLAAVKLLGWDHVDCMVWDVDHLAQLRLERGENDCREDLRPTEKHALAQSIKDATPERRGNPKLKPGNRPQLGGGSKPEKGQETRDFAAQQAGLGSAREMGRIGAVVEKGTPELREALDDGHVKPSAAARIADLSEGKQRKAVKLIVKEGASVKQALGEVDGKEEPVLDALGQEVPARIRDEFADTSMPDAVRAIKRVMAIVRSAQGWCGHYLPMKEILDGLERALKLIQNAIPFCVCPTCKGEKKPCSDCDYLGWLPQWRYFDMTHADEETARRPAKARKVEDEDAVWEAVQAAAADEDAKRNGK
jgi:hypothetical protein